MLCREGTVDEFCNRFMALSCQDPSLTEAQQILLFIAELSLLLCTDVALHQLGTLDDVVKYAQAYEQCGSILAATPAPVVQTIRTQLL
jgi:hypothetical protein